MWLLRVYCIFPKLSPKTRWYDLPLFLISRFKIAGKPGNLCASQAVFGYAADKRSVSLSPATGP